MSLGHTHTHICYNNLLLTQADFDFCRNTWHQAWRYSMIQMNQKNLCTTISVFMERCCSIVWVCTHTDTHIHTHYVIFYWNSANYFFPSMDGYTTFSHSFIILWEYKHSRVHTAQHSTHTCTIYIRIFGTSYIHFGAVKRYPFSFVIVFHLLHPFYFTHTHTITLDRGSFPKNRIYLHIWNG